MTWRHVLLYFVCLLVVLAVMFGFSLMFTDTGYGLTRISDLDVWHV